MTMQDIGWKQGDGDRGYCEDVAKIVQLYGRNIKLSLSHLF